MADRDQKMLPNYEQQQADGSEKVKIICLGDSAVGKSKYVIEFLFLLVMISILYGRSSAPVLRKHRTGPK